VLARRAMEDHECYRHLKAVRRQYLAAVAKVDAARADLEPLQQTLDALRSARVPPPDWATKLVTARENIGGAELTMARASAELAELVPLYAAAEAAFRRVAPSIYHDAHRAEFGAGQEQFAQALAETLARVGPDMLNL